MRSHDLLQVTQFSISQKACPLFFSEELDRRDRILYQLAILQGDTFGFCGKSFSAE